MLIKKTDKLTWHVALLIKLRKTEFFKLVKPTLTSIFPFVLLGSFCQLIRLNLFTSNGFLVSILGLQHWALTNQNINELMLSLTKLINATTVVMAAFLVAKKYTQLHECESRLSGGTAALSLLFLTAHYTNNEFRFYGLILTTQGLTWAMLLGFLVGIGFRYLGKSVSVTKLKSGDTVSMAISEVLPIALIVIILILVKLGIGKLDFQSVGTHITGQVQQLVANSYFKFVWFLILGILAQLAEFLGFSGDLWNNLGQNAQIVNLNVALSKHSAVHVPNSENFHNLFVIFGNVGGQGMLLSLVVLILLVGRNKNLCNLSRLSLMPAFFNLDGPIMVGFPILYLSTYLIPFVFAPVINMILAWPVLALHLIPAPVYPVPAGTPGILMAFIGTGGDWGALVFSIVCFGTSMIIYYPFLRIEEQLLHEFHLDVPLAEVEQHEN